MPKIAKELSALEVNRLRTRGNHAVGGVSGLYLYVNENGARSWVMRLTIGSKRRHVGLGSFPTVSLAMAREQARACRIEIMQGKDPLEEKRTKVAKLRAEQAAQITFAKASESYIAAHGDTWKNPKHRAQWASSLKTYADPVMGNLAVRDICQEHVLKTLEPIWKDKNETASRVRGRIESVLDWCTVRGYRSGDNPARWKGHLDKLLPAPSKVKKIKHFAALPFNELPHFMSALRQRKGTAARALEFAILCASRSGEVRGAQWSEIDLDAKVWTVPADRMKAGKEHRVPLTETAIRILNEQSKLPRQNDYVFEAPNGGQLSDMTLSAVLRRMEVDAVPHGFRSTFRDWAGEVTHFPRELAEQALAHTLESKVEAAYRRGDALEKRREMMQTWDDYCHSTPTKIDQDHDTN